jgi:hypothetical protein
MILLFVFVLGCLSDSFANEVSTQKWNKAIYSYGIKCNGDGTVT